MDDGTQTPLERAFQLARSGRFAKVSEIKQALTAEGFSVAQLTGRLLSNQLRTAMDEAKARNNADRTKGQTPPT
jgi:hypothetical protein